MKYLLSLLLCFTPVVFSKKWTSDDYPDPTSKLNECGRQGHKSYICDPDRILSYDNANQIERELQLLSNETNCKCPASATVGCNYQRNQGFYMGIALMKSMAPLYNDKVQKMLDDASTTSEREFIKLDVNMQQSNQFSFDILNKWDLGRCGDDLILIYAEDDNVLYTFTGEVTAQYLKPSVIAEVTLKHRIYIGPKKNTLQGLRGIIKDYKAQLLGEFRRETSPRYQADAAAVRARRGDSAAGSKTTAAVLVTSLLSLLVSLSLH